MESLIERDETCLSDGRWVPVKKEETGLVDLSGMFAEVTKITISHTQQQVSDFFEVPWEDLESRHIILFLERAFSGRRDDERFCIECGFCNLPLFFGFKFPHAKHQKDAEVFVLEIFSRFMDWEDLWKSFFLQCPRFIQAIKGSALKLPDWFVSLEASILQEEEAWRQLSIESKREQKEEVRETLFVQQVGERAPYLLFQNMRYPVGQLSRKNIEKLAESVKRKIDKELEPVIEQFRGFYPIGAKIHFPEAVSEEDLQEIQRQFGFSSTPFKMLHANTSMLMPACESAVQLAMIIRGLQKTGVLDPEKDPDLQFCIAGRLNNQFSGILGSSLIFNSRTCVEYGLESFVSSHNDQTGSCIMAYDAGVLDMTVGDLPEDIVGRTDMLMRRDLQDALYYQILGSLVSQAAWGGVFEDIGREYVAEYLELLRSYNMEHILESPWVYDSERDTDHYAEEHHALVKICTDRWRADFDHYQNTGSQDGLRYDAKRLLTKYTKKIKIRQKEVFGDAGLLMDENLTLNLE